MIKILFVCHGNICRSPMAEYIFRDMLAKKGLSGQFEIASAAVSTEELGNPVYPPAARELSKLGIRCKGKHSRQLTRQDGRDYDFLIAMEDRNIPGMRAIVGSTAGAKIEKLLRFAGEDGNIADPWYTGDFASTREDILRGCEGLLNCLLKKGMVHDDDER